MDKSIDLRLYTINEAYVKYLQKFDPNVKDNIKNGRTRPYIGVVLEINTFKYYIPLCSPKPKHYSMQDKLDFIKIQDGEELKAVLNINNMMPVLDTEISLIDIENQPQVYQDLLNKEHILIKKKGELIVKNSLVIYSKTTKNRQYNEGLANKRRFSK
jgi:protein AbiQ